MLTQEARVALYGDSYASLVLSKPSRVYHNSIVRAEPFTIC